MSNTVPVIAQLDADTLALVDRVATASGRTREAFAADAIRRMAEEEAEFAAFVQEGLDDLRAARTHTQADVEARFGVRRPDTAAA